MTCAKWHDSISARLDGELGPLEEEALDAHLARCHGCRAWETEAARVTRAARLTEAAPVPDLTAAILAAAPAPAPQRATAPVAAPPFLRWALALVALGQLVLAIPAVALGDDAGASVHVAHHLGSWEVALGIGLLFAAWRPHRAEGMVPLVAALVACVVVTSVVDLTDGRVASFSETQHSLEIVGLAMLWLLAHPLHVRHERTSRTA